MFYLAQYLAIFSFLAQYNYDDNGDKKLFDNIPEFQRLEWIIYTVENGRGASAPDTLESPSLRAHI